MRNDPKVLGATLRKQRIDLGLSQEDVADQLGISRNTISAIEDGKRRHANILLESMSVLGCDLLIAPRHSAETNAIRNNMAHIAHSIRHRGKRSCRGGPATGIVVRRGCTRPPSPTTASARS